MDRALFELTPNPVLIYDRESLQIMEANKAFLDKYGYKSEEAKELTLYDLRPNIADKELKKFLDQREDDEANKTDVVKHCSKDGTLFYVMVSCHPYKKDCENARMAFIHDVTERVEAERKAQKAYYELSHHVNHSPLAMIKWDENYEIIEWSKRAEEITGYTKREVLGQNPEFFDFYEEGLESVRKDMNYLVSGKRNRSHFETRMYHRQGHLVDINVHSSALRDENGKLVSVLTFIEDVTERKQTKIRYQRLFENANDGILIAKHNKWVECNDKVLELFGASRDDIIGKSPLDYSPEKQPDGLDSEQKMDQIIEKVLAGDPQIFEWQHLKKDGTPLEVQVSLNRIDLVDGVYIQAIIRDLSEQKKAELKYQRLFENANDGIFLMKGDKFVECNSQVVNIYGLESKEDIIGKSPVDFSPEYQPDGKKSEDKAQEKIQRALDGTPQVFEWQHEALDGTPVAVEVSLNRLQLVEDVYVQALVRDLTEQKKAQEKLRKSEKLFRKLFLKAPGAMVMIDPNNRVKRVNKSFEDLFGYAEEELQGNDIDEIIVGKDDDQVIPRMPDRGFREDKFYTDIIRYTKDGEKLNLLLGAIPVYLDDEPIAGFGIYVDVTEQKKYQQQLQQSVKEKQVLLEEIHHRVKNNLAIISGMLQLQAFEAENPEIKGALNDGQLRIQSIGIVHELLYQSDDFIDISFEEYISKLVKTIRETLPFEHQHIDVQVDTGNVLLDINQAIPSAILINELVTNAYKHAFTDGEAGTIQITLEEKDQTISIYVADDGMGLPKEFTVENQSSIGMNLIQTLTDQLDGDLEYHSGNGDGTEFCIRFEKTKDKGSGNLYLVEGKA